MPLRGSHTTVLCARSVNEPFLGTEEVVTRSTIVYPPMVTMIIFGGAKSRPLRHLYTCSITYSSSWGRKKYVYSPLVSPWRTRRNLQKLNRRVLDLAGGKPICAGSRSAKLTRALLCIAGGQRSRFAPTYAGSRRSRVDSRPVWLTQETEKSKGVYNGFCLRGRGHSLRRLRKWRWVPPGFTAPNVPPRRKPRQTTRAKGKGK